MRKRLVIATLAIMVGLGGGLLALNHIMASQDADHAAFYHTGASIKTFVSDYGQAFRSAFDAKEMTQIASFFASDYPGHDAQTPGGRAFRRGPWRWEAHHSVAEVSSFKLVSSPPWLQHPAEVIAAITAYHRELQSIANIRSKIDMIEHIEDDHQNVVLRVKFILDGTTLAGEVFQDRHFYRWHVRRMASEAADPAWHIVSDELIEGVRVIGNAQHFVALEPSRSGIDYRHARNPKLNKEHYGEQLKFDIVEHAAGGVTITDYNNDGWPDLFFADGQRSRLYRHNGVPEDIDTPIFTETTRAAGLDGIDQAHAGIFADVNNDGFQDLVITRYLNTNRFFVNNGDGTFSDRSEAMGLDVVTSSTSAVFLDYDRDGFLDLYVAAFGNAFTDSPRIPFFAQNGQPNRLFKNHGGRRFSDVTLASGVGDTGWSLAAAAADYDNDGYPDLVVANDFGRKNLYHNNGDGTFSEVAKATGTMDFSGGMGVAVADVNDDGHLDFYFSNINSNQRWFGEDKTLYQYLRNLLRTKWVVLDLWELVKLYNLVGAGWTELGKQVGEGNSLFRNNGDGTFSELQNSHTNRAGWGWGVAFFDADNDADLDIYAANGWISNTPDSDL